MAGKKNKKKATENPADLDTTMRDDYRGHKDSHRSHRSLKEIEEEPVKLTKKEQRKMMYSSEGADGFTSETLDNDYQLTQLVKLPPNVTVEEWIYSNLVDFVQEITLLYDSISDECTSATCPEMTAGPHYTYLWTDAHGSNPVNMSANEYVNTLFQYISDLFKRPPFIDCKNGVFPEEFIPTVKNIFKRLFRVYSHVYHHHLNEFIRTGAEVHLNTSFKHFVLFEREFGLVSRKEELPLRKLIKRLIRDDDHEDDGKEVVPATNSASYRAAY